MTHCCNHPNDSAPPDPMMRWVAAAGGFAWLAALPALWNWDALGWVEAMLLMGALVVVPLGLGLISIPRKNEWEDKIWRWACLLELPAALLLIAALCTPKGTAAAALTVPYLAITVLLAVSRFGRLRRQGPGPPDAWCFDAALVFLAGGAGWTFISRLGVDVLGYSDIIIQLTPVHLHYAGFALPVLVGVAARATKGPLAKLACFGAVLGFPLVAAGMLLSHLSTIKWVEIVAVSLLAATCCLLASLQIQLALRSGRPAPLMLLCVSAVSLITGMVLAVVYAAGQYSGATWIDIPVMLPTHGALNALGFALCGMLAWHMEPIRR